MRRSVEDIKAILAEKVPEGRVIPEHTSDAHFYRDTWSEIPAYGSVTTKSSILDAPHLKKWAAKLAVENLVTNFDNVATAVMSKDDGQLELLKRQAILAHQDHLEDAGGVGTQVHNVVENYLNAWLSTGHQPDDIKTHVLDYLREASNFPEPVVDPRIHAGARSAEAFCRDYFVEPIASELLVVSHKHKYAGTLDALMMVGKVIQPGKEVTTLDGGSECPHTLMLISKSKLEYKCLHCEMKVKKYFALVDWKTSNSVDKPEYAMQVAAYWNALREMTGIQPQIALIVQLDKKHKKYTVVKLADRVGAFRAFTHVSKVYDWLDNSEDKIVPEVAKEQINLYA